MVLAGLVGWSLQHFAVLADAFVPALLIGMFVAMLVPAKGGCAVPGSSTGANAPDGR